MTGRRLTAILAADIAGYSALMGNNEVDTVAALKGHQSVVLPMIAGYDGRVIDTAGDGILAEFQSVFNAVKCAIAVQEVMLERNASVVPERRMQYRIGVNQGDVLFDEDRIYGDGINVAARLEGLCQPGGICVSGKVYDEIKGRFEIHYEDIGEQKLKNISAPVRTYRINLDARTPEKRQMFLLDLSRLSRHFRAKAFASVVAGGLFVFLAFVGFRLAGQRPTAPIVTAPTVGTGMSSPAPAIVGRPVRTTAEGPKPFDGEWFVTLTGGAHCALKSFAWPIAIDNHAIITPNNAEPGRVEANGDFSFTTPARVDPSIMVRYRGQLTGDMGRGEYKAGGGMCVGTIELKRLVRRP